MITKRPSHERGHFDHGWLDTRHTFSFARYHDPRYTSFRDLLVINEDRVQPSRGFPTHSHDNMEIISYVLEGALEHRDSLGNGSIIAGASLAHKLGPGRHAWIQVIDGALKLNGLSLTSGDGAAVSDEGQLRLDALAPSHLVLFELA